jgi:hypothetical protein
MRKLFSSVLTVAAFLTFNLATSVQTAHGQLRPYRVTDTQVRSLLSRIESNTDIFRNRLNNALDTSAINGSRREDDVVQYVSDFEQATDRLQQNFNARNVNTPDVEEVLSRATVIDNFMKSRRLNTSVQNQWTTLRTDLNTLAGYYRVSWNWNNQPSYPNNNYPGTGNGNNYPGNNYPGNSGGNNGGGFGGRGDALLTGTYKLNRTASDDVQAAIDRSYGGIGSNNQNQQRGRGLVRRLTPPDTLVLQKNNRNITIASDMAPQADVTADGVARTETSPNGRTVRTTTALQGNGFSINYEGDRMNDFYLSFTPAGRDQLRVVRRVYRENDNQTITVTSVYDKINSTPDWSVANTTSPYPGTDYGTGNNNGNNNGGNNSGYGNFIVPNGTRIVGVLDTPLSTKTVNEGDRFTMRVTSPAAYNGATITGYVSNTERSGRVTGRANMALNFEEIRLRNGQTYKFAGAAEQVRLPNGETVTVSNEGEVRDDNQTKKTAVRSGIGAAIGAIIGAVAGGGSGAAVGAAVGAGAGAGSVLVQGRDDLNLERGTEFVITASAPQNARL